MSLQPLPHDQGSCPPHNGEIETASDKIVGQKYVRLIDPHTGKLNAGLAQKDPCPLCEQSDEVFFNEREGFNFVRCKNCGMIYMSPRLADDVYLHRRRNDNALREQYHAQLTQQDDREDRSMKSLLLRLKASVPRGKLLDVGCGLGRFMLLARAGGYVVSGIEQHHFALHHARSSGLAVYEQPLEELKLSAQSIDLITAFDMLGKVQHPRQFLREVRRVLKANGRFMLSCPNIEGLGCQLLGAHAADTLTAPEQINWFNRQTLQQMLRQSGFKVLDLSTTGNQDLDNLRAQFDSLEQPLPPFFHRLLWQKTADTEELRRDLQALLRRHYLGSWLLAECAPNGKES